MAIFGTDGNDLLEGMPGADDIIFGYDGNDALNGLDGNDTLYGNRGNDTLDGGEGNDILWGGKDADIVMGGGGNDYLEGGFGADMLDGGEDDGYVIGVAETLQDNAWGDTVGYLLSDAGVTVNLATGTAEGGHAEDDTLTGIESVRGSHHDDVLTARDDDPSTEATLEGSILWGNRGDDALHGGTGRDILWGGKGDDTLMGGAARDFLEGGAGADTLDGGAGFDYAVYYLSDAGVTINLATGAAAGGHAEGDTFAGIEGLSGSRHADSLTGDDAAFNWLYGSEGNDTLDGGAGNDHLNGGAGADVLEGGEGFDAADYWLSDAGVTVNLATGTGQGGHAEGDTLTGFEYLLGSSHADHLIAHAGGSGLNGREGDDTLEGGASGDWQLQGGAGADLIDGGAGFDWAVYAESDVGVTVNLATGTGQGGHAEGDTLTGIEGIYGTSYADHLTGDGGNNIFIGVEGGDTLDGGEGGDTVNYRHSDAGVTVNLATGTGQGGHAEGDMLTGIEQVWGSDDADHLTGDGGDNSLIAFGGNDTLEGAAGDDFLGGGEGDDTLNGGAGNDRLDGHAGNDHLEGGAGHDILQGRAGADRLDGGEGSDSADYWGSDAGVTVNLATGTGQGGHAEGDTLTGIESVWGFDHADHLSGDAGDNTLDGRGGDDTLEGGAGNDDLKGREGADRLDGGEGVDSADYYSSDAGVTVNLATGTGQGGYAEGDTLTGIEQVWASFHADSLTGDGASNYFDGRDGDDTLNGGAGDDTLEGGAGADTLDGGAGDDHLEGDAGNDHLNGGAGDDTLEGGAGADTLDGGGDDLDSVAYWGSDAGVTVNLATGTGQGSDAEGDTLTGFRRVMGSDHADALTARDDDPDTEEAEGSIIHAGDGDDTLQGGTGTDHLEGGGGADRLDGGEGVDFAAYWGSDAGVTVNLATGTAQGGHAEGDTLTEIENVDGSDHADHLTGEDGGNAFFGGAGDDTLNGAAGSDWLDGGTGADLLTGGDDADTFVFGDGDTVTDFEDGSDRIQISDLGHITADNFDANVTIRQSGSDVEVQIGDAILTLNGVSAADVTVDDFILA